MKEHIEKQPKQQNSIASLLTNHVDEICDFHSYYSFFCDAVTAMAYREEPIDYETAEGITLFTSWLKRKHHKIKEQAKVAHRLSRDMEKNVCCKHTQSFS